MNQSQEILAPGIETVRDQSASQGIVSDLVMLTKARLSMLVVITTFVGFCMASGQIDWLLLFNTLLGTALVACSAAVLNQFIEVKVDRLMERTKVRPLPSGRMKSVTALWIGLGMGAAGILQLALTVNFPATCLALATWVIYLFVYTWLPIDLCGRVHSPLSSLCFCRATNSW